MNAAILALEDGTVFEGKSFGAPKDSLGEVVFNTSITGYQEIFTDPSYAGQIVVLTNPQIGNYGANAYDQEAARPYIEGLVVREFSRLASNWRSEENAEQFLADNGIPVAAEIDTRALVRHLRTRGVMRGVLSVGTRSRDELVERARKAPSMAGLDLATRVSTPASYSWDQPVEACSPSETLAKPAEQFCHVVAFDYGIKRNILRRLVHVGARVTVVPARSVGRRCSGAESGRRISIQRPRRSRAAGIPSGPSAKTDRQRSPSSESAWAIRFSDSRSAARPTSSSSDTAARTTPC